MPLQTVEPQRLYRQIAGQLRTLMAAGEFTAGARLPAEREFERALGRDREIPSCTGPRVHEAATDGDDVVSIDLNLLVIAQGRPVAVDALVEVR